MEQKKQLLLGTVTIACGSMSLTATVLAGDGRGLPLPGQSGADKVIESPRDLSPIMKKLIGEGNGAKRHKAGRHGYMYFEHDGSDDFDDDDFESTDPEDFETDEFNASSLPGQIKAQAAYARDAFGAGATVGIVDSEFDVDHPELEANVSAFKDVEGEPAILNEDGQILESPADTDSPEIFRLFDQVRDQIEPEEDFHGTNVAGVVAAARNGDGIVGVAPEAKLVLVDIDSPVLADVSEDFFAAIDDDDVVDDVDVDVDDVDVGPDSDTDVVEIILAPTDENPNEPIRIVKASLFGGDGVFSFAELRERVGNGEIRALIPTLTQQEDAIAKGVDFADERGSDIINMSLGIADREWSPELQQSIFSATENGRIVVLAGGNEDRIDLETGEPLEEIPDTDLSSQIVVDERTNGLALAVGVVDENNEIQYNNCGSAKERCLVAPGIDIETTTDEGEFEEVSGSSFAAPAVSGSLALLLDLFPTISPEDAVKILLTSATDLGEEGVDEVYGHGLVNIERAVQPIGVASLPLGGNVKGSVATLASSKIGLSGAFGDALRNIGALKNGLFLDKFRRPFAADLRGRVITDRRGIDFTGVLSSSDIKTEHVTSGAFTTSLSLKRDVDEDPFFRPSSKAGLVGAFEEDQGDLQALSFSGEIVDGVTMRAGHNLTAGQQLAVDPVSGPASNLFLFTEDSTNPQHGFLGKGSGLSVTHQLTDQTQFSLGMMSAEGEGDSDREAGFTTQADLRHSFANESKIGLSFSFTGEGSGFLGSEIGGAFADQAETNSQFLTLSGSTPLTASIDLLGSASMGRSDLSGVNGGIVDNIDNVMTSAFMVGVAKNGLFDDKDKLGLMVSQPLRVESGGKASFDVPTSVNADGSIETTRTEASLAPSGREMNLQLAYSRKLSDSMDVTTYTLMRDEPGHNAKADRDYGVGMRFKVSF